MPLAIEGFIEWYPWHDPFDRCRRILIRDGEVERLTFPNAGRVTRSAADDRDSAYTGLIRMPRQALMSERKGEL